MRAHRRRGGLHVRDPGLDGGPRRSRHRLGRRGLGSRRSERGLGCHRCRAQRSVRGGCFGLGNHRNDDQQTDLIRHQVAMSYFLA